MTAPSGRPSTFAGCLENLSDWLDATDKYIKTYGPAKDHGIPKGNRVQTDLRRLAVRIAEEPALDRMLMKLMTEGEDL